MGTVVMSICKGTAPIEMDENLAKQIKEFVKQKGWKIKEIPTRVVRWGDDYEGGTRYYIQLLPRHWLLVTVKGSHGEVRHAAEWVEEPPPEAEPCSCPIESYSTAAIFGMSHNVVYVSAPE